jgi:hypothetical protein
MDPNTVLDSIRHSLESGAGTELVDDVEALDGWLMKQGFLPKDWEENCNGGLLKRALVAQSVYEAWQAVFPGGVVVGYGTTHVWIGNLMGALLLGRTFMLPKHPPSAREEFLRMFPADHAVWAFVTEEK